jgi:hypothetical protein
MAGTHRSAGPLLAAGGLAVFVVGLLGGTWIGSSRVDAGEGPAVRAATPGEPELRDAIATLARELETLRAELAMARGMGPTDGELGPLSDELEELRDELLALREVSSRQPVGGSGGDVLPGTLERRLRSLEELVQQRMVVMDGRGSWPLRVPVGEPDRSSLAALLSEIEEHGNSDQVTRRHQLMSYQAILDRYGPPDEVLVQDSHIEFEYAVPERDDNFDFHFVDGFCVVAH